MKGGKRKVREVKKRKGRGGKEGEEKGKGMGEVRSSFLLQIGR